MGNTSVISVHAPFYNIVWNAQHEKEEVLSRAKNVLGTALQTCSEDPMTGFYRTGCCDTGREDVGLHIVCTQVTAEFLEFSKSVGNDLSTPVPEYQFPGLKPGNRWCLCALRWKEAWQAGKAPPVVLDATHISILEFIDLDVLKAHAVES